MKTPDCNPEPNFMSRTLEPAEPIATVDIRYAGRTVSVPDMCEYSKFYGKLAGGCWEANTFATLARNLDRDTVLVDIGAWIGVTPMWSAQIARKVIAVEPDPKCVAILNCLTPAAGNVTVIEGALTDRSEVAIHAVDGFGSSETSVLDIGDGAQASVRGFGIDEIMRHAEGAPVFVKIDIEGYEYEIAPELSKLQNYPLRGLQIAVHPQLYEKSLKGNRLWRRLRTAWATWRLGRLLGRFIPGPTLHKFEGLGSYILGGILFRGKPKGADFVFERNSAPTSEDKP
jgi:FkbM family methyltransferase